jgi:ubiquinone biosynthesis protein Coq4
VFRLLGSLAYFLHLSSKQILELGQVLELGRILDKVKDKMKQHSQVVALCQDVIDMENVKLDN